MNLPKASSSRPAPTKSRLHSVLPPAIAHSTRDRPQATLSWGPEIRRERLGQSDQSVLGLGVDTDPLSGRLASLRDKSGWSQELQSGLWLLLKWKVEREKKIPALSSRCQDVRPCPSGGGSRGHKSPDGELPGFYTKHTGMSVLVGGRCFGFRSRTL